MRIYLCILFLLGVWSTAQAQIPAEIAYQGYLLDNGVPADGNYILTFKLHTSGVGTASVWSETHNIVPVTDGVYNVTLGSNTSLAGVDFNQGLWLGVRLGTNPELLPRTKLATVPYTFGLRLPYAASASVAGAANAVITVGNTSTGDALRIEDAGDDGIQVNNADDDGLFVNNAGGDGVNVDAASVNGLTVSEAGNYGVFAKTLGDAAFGTDMAGVYGENAGPAGSGGYFKTSSTTNVTPSLIAETKSLGPIMRGLGPADNLTFQFLNTGALEMRDFDGNQEVLLDPFGAGAAGELTLSSAGAEKVQIRAVGSTGASAGLFLYNDLHASAALELLASEQAGQGANINLRNAAGTRTIELDSDFNGDGRVITDELELKGGSDLSEFFDVTSLPGLALPEAGHVVSIDPARPGKLAVSAVPYDPLVAGIISGAGGIETGLTMRQEGTVADGDVPVALVGRVYVWADATYGAIQPGDWLTTSATPGHAMRAERARAGGTTLGKAMTGLDAGRGLVLVLITLQ